MMSGPEFSKKNSYCFRYFGDGIDASIVVIFSEGEFYPDVSIPTG